MLADIHGVDPTQFKANLGDHPSHGGSRKKRRKDPPVVDGGARDSDTGDEGLELYQEGSVEHLDIQA